MNETRWLPQFFGLAVLWGCSFAFIEVGLQALTSIQVSFGRIFFGALTLLIITLFTRARLPRGLRTWGHVVVVATLLNALPFTLFALGQQNVSSILAAIINAATPLATLLAVIVAFPEEKPTWTRAAGLGLGFAGILVVLGIWQSMPSGEVGGILACFGAIACYGVGIPYSRRYLSGSGATPVGLATSQVSMAALLLVPVLLISGTSPIDQVTGQIVLAMLALGSLGSGVAFILYFQVIARAGATTASSVTYLTPVVAAIVGIAFLGERLTWNEPVGAAIVLLGVALSQSRAQRAKVGPRASAKKQPAAAAASTSSSSP
ncbi:DMT family transporter [Ornithinimicrobium sp. Arc0846-15]|nr:DMT family transporter [Ornithinimicrobium laminariae]